MSEIDYRQKYKYYKREMLESLLVSGRKLQDAEILAIQTLIQEMPTKVDSNLTPEFFFDGGIKDEIIITTRWHVVILAINFLI